MEISSCCYTKDDIVDSQQYPASIKATEMLQGLRLIGSVHQWVDATWASCLEFIWDGGGLGFRQEYYALNGVQTRSVQERRSSVFAQK